MQNQYLTHSSTDNFGSPIPVSDWLIFCSGYLMLRQKKKKKKNENDKKTNFMMKSNKKMPKNVYKALFL